MDIVVWVAFTALILSLLALDLGVFHREVRAPTFYEAIAWSGFWISLAVAFAGVVYLLYERNVVGAGLAFPPDISGRQASLEYLTGWLLEKSLSLDNIFVIAVIFSHFRVPLAFQHRVLYWGVLGAIVLRGAMIGVGATLLHSFSWMTYVFGGLLIFTAARMILVKHGSVDPSGSLVTRLVARLVPVTDTMRGAQFFVVENGVRFATPLFVVLVLVESTDLLFAVDSIPAIFAVTSDPFLVFSSNVFAILGLRSLYFALAPLLEKFRFLRPSLVLILAFIGIKMVLAHHADISTTASLIAIGAILAMGLLASLALPGTPATSPSPFAAELSTLRDLTAPIAKRAVSLTLGGTLITFGTMWFVFDTLRVLVVTIGVAILAAQLLWAREMLISAAKVDPTSPRP